MNSFKQSSPRLTGGEKGGEMDQQYGLEFLKENQKLRDEIERLNTELQQMKVTVPDYDILEQTSQEGLVNIVVGLMNELEQYKEALRLAAFDAENEIGCPPAENRACCKWQGDYSPCIDCITNYYLTKAKGG
jgi:hypothetical protein